MRRIALALVLAFGFAWPQTASAQAMQDALRAFDALAREDWQLAEFYATRAVEAGTLAPGDHAAVTAYRGDARRHLGDLAGAIADYTRALDAGLPPAFAARTLSNRGITLFGTGNYDRAMTDFTEAIRRDPAFAEPLVNRGATHLQLGRLDRAFDDLTQAIRLNANNPRAFTNRGQVYMELQFFEEAVDDFTTAMDLSPTPEAAIVPLFNRGLAWEALGEEGEAFQDFALAYDLAPDHPQYWEKYIEYGLMAPPGAR